MTRSGPAPHEHDDAHMRILRLVRDAELLQALKFFPQTGPVAVGSITVLEVGAGTGQQARALDRGGYSVVAIDVASSHYRNDRVFPITEYDGHSIPLGDDSVDVVFSSHVLEHVTELDVVLAELARVMRPDGIAIHILPTSTARLWTMGAHYIWAARRVIAGLSKKILPESRLSERTPNLPSGARQWMATLFPLRHGERGNSINEFLFYTRRWWTEKFLEHGFTVDRAESNGIFYTMANSLGDAISLEMRRTLSRALGSSCRIYVLRRSGNKSSLRGQAL